MEELVVSLDVCSYVFAALTDNLQNSFASSFFRSINVFIASIFAAIALFAMLIVAIELSAKLLTVLA